MSFVEIRAGKAVRIFRRDVHENTFTIRSANLTSYIYIYIYIYIYTVYIYIYIYIYIKEFTCFKTALLQAAINCNIDLAPADYFYSQK